MAVMDTLIRWVTGQQRSYPTLSLDDWVAQFSFQGQTYLTGLNQTMTGNREEIAANFTGLVQGAYKSNGIVYACVQARLMLLSQARFQWQQMRGGVPGDLFGTNDLSILEHPEPGKVTADLIARASVDVDLAGNHFLARRVTDGQLRLKRLRPDWVTIVLGSPNPAVEIDSRDIDAEVIGYAYQPGGRGSGIPPEFLLRELVAHIAPIPDPIAHYRGMSWLTPLIREIQSDSAATSHKELFFANAATPNMVVVRKDAPSKELFDAWVSMIEQGHTGLANAYRTLYLTAGAEASVVGANLQQLEFSATQGAGETRIAAASGIHPVILGLSEGLSGSSLNQGNFMAARRLTADKALRPFWGNFASSLEVVVPPPSGARLWYDERSIPFLREDSKDLAEIQNQEAQTMRQLYDAGWLPPSIVKAVQSQDWSLLEHSGLPSVQNQPAATEPATNGQVSGEEANALVSQEG